MNTGNESSSVATNPLATGGIWNTVMQRRGAEHFHTPSGRQSPFDYRRKPSNTPPQNDVFPQIYNYANYLEMTTKQPSKNKWRRRYTMVCNNTLLCAKQSSSDRLETVVPLATYECSMISDEIFAICHRRSKKTVYFRPPIKEHVLLWIDCIQRCSKLKIKDIYTFLYSLTVFSKNKRPSIIAARHRYSNMDCAIQPIDKRVLSADIQILKRLKTENICDIIEMIETSKFVYIVMHRSHFAFVIIDDFLIKCGGGVNCSEPKSDIISIYSILTKEWSVSEVTLAVPINVGWARLNENRDTIEIQSTNQFVCNIAVSQLLPSFPIELIVEQWFREYTKYDIIDLKRIILNFCGPVYNIRIRSQKNKNVIKKKNVPRRQQNQVENTLNNSTSGFVRYTPRVFPF